MPPSRAWVRSATQRRCRRCSVRTAGADVETRLKIVEAAEQIDGGGASGLLMTALKDPDPRIRKKAAEALGDSD